MLTTILICLVLAGFVLMTLGVLRQEVAMPLVALGAISLAGNEQGFHALEEGFREFSRIALLFTAVAVPAHVLQRSNFLEWIGLWVGEKIGRTYVASGKRLSPMLLVPAYGLAMVYMMAAIAHNTTSILVSR